MDADYSHRFEDLEQLLAESHFQDVVINGNISVVKLCRLGYEENYYFGCKQNFTYCFKININDMTSGFRCYSERAISLINFQNTKSDGYSFQIEMSIRSIENKLSIKEVPIIFNERRLGKSKMSKRIVLELCYFWLIMELKDG